MELTVTLTDLMDAVDRESEFDDYGYFLDPATGATHFLWDGRADEVDDDAAFEALSERVDELIKLPDRSLTDLYARAADFATRHVADERQRAKLTRACHKARRKRNIGLFLAEITTLGLNAEQRAFWDACDEAFVRRWCAEAGIAIAE
ncbi:hypothetical protein VJ918_09880 [Adlercreutzia sp. R21]|uniref:hypothetical protein n=1 Tax=Adlercreutzia wanghongyangiae TaxID=3111451 RepID=UPI002DBFACDC|nr:hypothetical protein [Adlercreutzia sp. R21]MEC4185117.1 hypothetical protein [Adlercreutzia sp. R21]